MDFKDDAEYAEAKRSRIHNNMNPLTILLLLLVVISVLFGLLVIRRSGASAQMSYDFRSDPQVWEYHRKELIRIKSELGETPEGILSRFPVVERRELYSAIQTLCSWKRLNNMPLSGLEEFVLVSTGLGMEVTSGGFQTYFFNSAGDDWNIMLEGMQKAGNDVGVARFNKVLLRFPDGRPSTVRSERWKQLQAFGEGQYKIFENDDSDFFNSPFPDWDKIWEYVVSHIDEIKPIRDSEQAQGHTH